MLSQLNIFFTKSKIFLCLEITFIIGIFLGKYLNFNQNFLLMLIFLQVFSLCLIKKQRLIFISLSLIFSLFIGIGYFNCYQKYFSPEPIDLFKEINLVGTITTEPDQRETNTKLTLRIIQADVNENVLIGQKILVSVPVLPKYQYGDQLELKGKISKPETFDDFNYADYLSRYQIFYLMKNPNVSLLANNKGNLFLKKIFDIKQQADSNLKQILPEPEASFLSGVVLGTRKGIDKKLNEAFIATGTSHIVAISGLNVVILVAFFQIITKRWSKKLVFILGISSLILYSIVTGLTASVVRASILASLFIFAKFIGRKGNIINILMFVGTIMIIQNPLILHFDVGFQLSFLAILGMIFLSPIFNKIFLFIKNENLRDMVAVTFSAQLATLPIILYNFKRLSIISPLVNILVVFVVNIATVLGFILTCMTFINITLAQCFGYVVWLLLKYIVIVVQYFSKFYYSNISINFSNWFYVLIYYILVCVVVFSVYKFKKIKPIKDLL